MKTIATITRIAIIASLLSLGGCAWLFDKNVLLDLDTRPEPREIEQRALVEIQRITLFATAKAQSVSITGRCKMLTEAHGVLVRCQTSPYRYKSHHIRTVILIQYMGATEWNQYPYAIKTSSVPRL